MIQITQKVRKPKTITKKFVINTDHFFIVLLIMTRSTSINLSSNINKKNHFE